MNSAGVLNHVSLYWNARNPENSAASLREKKNVRVIRDPRGDKFHTLKIISKYYFLFILFLSRSLFPAGYLLNPRQTDKRMANRRVAQTMMIRYQLLRKLRSQFCQLFLTFFFSLTTSLGTFGFLVPEEFRT